MGKEKPVPPLPASSHADLQIFVLLAPSKNSNLISLSLANQGPLLKLLRLNFLGKPPQKHQHRTYKYILISVHCKISPTTQSGLESRWCPPSTPEQILGMSGPCLTLSYTHSSDLSVSSTLGGPSPQCRAPSLLLLL